MALKAIVKTAKIQAGVSSEVGRAPSSKVGVEKIKDIHERKIIRIRHREK